MEDNKSQQYNHKDIQVFYRIKESREGRKHISLKMNQGINKHSQAIRNMCLILRQNPVFFICFFRAFFKGYTLGGAHKLAVKMCPEQTDLLLKQFVSLTVAVMASRNLTEKSK